jgi:hypothetical protein
MNISPENEKKLWEAAKASRISDIAGLSLASHAALKAAVVSGVRMTSSSTREQAYESTLEHDVHRPGNGRRHP